MGRGWIVLAASALAACSSYSGVETTPTFTRARLESAPQPLTAPEVPAARPSVSQAPQRPPRVSGARAVYQATRAATVEPTDVSMQGAAWVVEHGDVTRIYLVPTRLQRVTTILLPEGEQINKITGGNVEGFLVEGSYAGARPAISVLPAYPEAGTNLAVSTTGGLYGFQLCVYEHT
jgi:type IV secretory pathway VirB9-like protein